MATAVSSPVIRNHLAADLDGGIAGRAAIGVVVLATDNTLEYEFRKLLDLPGVAFYASRIMTSARVTPETLVEQMKIADREDELSQPYHQMILNDEIPLSIGGGIGQSRTQMLLLRKAHLGEVSTTVWPKQLHDVCEKHNIFVLK